jgi:hypothetical protein
VLSNVEFFGLMLNSTKNEFSWVVWSWIHHKPHFWWCLTMIAKDCVLPNLFHGQAAISSAGMSRELVEHQHSDRMNLHGGSTSQIWQHAMWVFCFTSQRSRRFRIEIVTSLSPQAEIHQLWEGYVRSLRCIARKRQGIGLR